MSLLRQCAAVHLITLSEFLGPPLYSQAQAEFALLLDFVKLADELGHRVPCIDTYLRLSKGHFLPEIHNYPLIRFIPEFNPAAALAQHHGVPTRALDWTRSPLYAVYFAASEVEFAQSEGEIAVWAIRPDLLKEIGRGEIYNSEYTRFLDHAVPNFDNLYLRAQEGVFILPAYGCAHIAQTGVFPNLESFALAIQDAAKLPVIRKLTLPYGEVGELLRLLWLKGVSRAQLMPTIDNVTHALCARWKWAT